MESDPSCPVPQARNDAVGQKLHVLDQKLLRAQISEEDKLKVSFHTVFLANSFTTYLTRLPTMRRAHTYPHFTYTRTSC